MARIKGSTPTRNRRKKILKLASGYFGSKHLLYRTAHEQVMHSWKYAYIHRRELKREMRKLWIARINAAARLNGMSYSKLMHGLKEAGVAVNRKMLSEIAIHNPEDFTKICEVAKKGKAPAAKKEEAPKAKKEAKAEKKEEPKIEVKVEETAETPKPKKTAKKKAEGETEEKKTVKKVTRKKKTEE